MPRLLCSAVLVAFLVGAAAAGCPDKVGLFNSIGPGLVLSGRISEAWCTDSPAVAGNMVNALSWNGSDLGTQWSIWGMVIDAAGTVLVSDSLSPSGNGVRTYRTSYDGGSFELDGTGPWGDGVTDVTGAITDCVAFTTVTFVNFTLVAATRNITFAGNFTECHGRCWMEIAIYNAPRIWLSGQGTIPADYPALLCDATSGELFDSPFINIGITCMASVTVSEETWGSLKALYR